MSELFLIAIGGTGMRCLEAFINLSAIGMLDRKEISVLAIDTDFNNGNLNRTKKHIENYLRVKRSGSNRGASAHKDSYFSCKLNFYYFSPEYDSDRQTFRTLSKINRLGEQASQENQLLADLLFDPGAQKFNLSHGYRAQTHLGSHLMYHAILEEFREVQAGRAERPDGISKFIEALSNAGESPKVFIMGSIFGGTGASSIPILPKALRDAKKQIDPAAELPTIIYGATLLTSYFKFSKPKGEQIAKEHLIADSDRFGLNCQAALKFYIEDLTIRKSYKRFYHVGWPIVPYDYDNKELKDQQNRSSDKVMTGGAEQENPAHVIEMLCAFSAYHFFKDERLRSSSQLSHVYKSIAIDKETRRALFTFEDLVGTERKEINRLKRKLSGFLAFATMIQTEFDGRVENFIQGLQKGSKDTVNAYLDIPEGDYKALNEFLASFSFELRNASVESRWIQQVQQSVEVPEFMTFNKDLYSTEFRTLKKVNWARLWNNPDHHFPAARRSLVFKASAYERFATHFRGADSLNLGPDPEIEKPVEKLLNHIYKTMNHLHKIED